MKARAIKRLQQTWYFKIPSNCPRLNPIQTGGGGLFESPLRQNRDNFYTERAMTVKYSDFS